MGGRLNPAVEVRLIDFSDLDLKVCVVEPIRKPIIINKHEKREKEIRELQSEGGD